MGASTSDTQPRSLPRERRELEARPDRVTRRLNRRVDEGHEETSRVIPRLLDSTDRSAFRSAMRTTGQRTTQVRYADTKQNVHDQDAQPSRSPTMRCCDGQYRKQQKETPSALGWRILLQTLLQILLQTSCNRVWYRLCYTLSQTNHTQLEQ